MNCDHICDIKITVGEISPTTISARKTELISTQEDGTCSVLSQTGTSFRPDTQSRVRRCTSGASVGCASGRFPAITVSRDVDS